MREPYLAKIDGDFLALPRGFLSTSVFEDFSSQIVSVLSSLGGTVKIQGSSLMNFPDQLKDVDIISIVSSSGFNAKLKVAFIESHYIRYVPNGGGMSDDYINSVTDLEFEQYLIFLKNASDSNISASEKVLKNADFRGLLSTNQNLIDPIELDEIQSVFNLSDLDVSLVRENAVYSNNPFITLN